MAERAGLPGEEEAERTVRTVLGILCGRLTWPSLQSLAEDLPASLAESLRGVTPNQDFDLAELHARVARRANLGLGFAVEHTAVVCQAVAEALSPAALHRLREALPESMGALFTLPAPAERFEHIHLDPSHHTLAEGRPGSQHPLSESRPERAHTGSVVRADNPHADTKLSSAGGLTQEREQETLAAGRPGSSRPLSEAD
ncbi:MAG: DUF2267 domain-containing protein [Myxococcaceae bacterium]|nr:DUF2267 domain-containing protein [Myxococcaceae bacterium]